MFIEIGFFIKVELVDVLCAVLILVGFVYMSDLYLFYKDDEVGFAINKFY